MSRAASVRGLAEQRPLATFTALAFAFAWLPWGALLADHELPPQVSMIGLAAPALAALVTAGLAEGPQGCANVLGRLGRIRFHAGWWALAAGLMPAVYGLAAVAFRLLAPSGPAIPWIAPTPLVVLSFPWLLVVTAGEEIGWRGFALPRLLRAGVPRTAAALGLGVVWGVWHLPVYILSDQSAFPWPLFLALTCLLSVIYLLLFLRSGGSLLPALLLHATTDFAPRVIAIGALDWRYWALVDGLLLIAVSAIVLARYFDPSHRPVGSC